MPIRYGLNESHLGNGTEDNTYTARVLAPDSADLGTIVERVTAQGSKWTGEDVRAVMGAVTHAVEDLLVEGRRINIDGLCELYPRIAGVFHGITDHFDPARHRVDVGARPSIKLRHTVRESAHVTKEETIKPTPAPLEYQDIGSGDTDGALTPGNIGTLNGHRLKFDPAKADEGIFLLPVKATADSPKETRITVVQKNKPSQLVFLVPADLAKGGYQLEVRARVQGSTELRLGRLDATLSA
uniref:DNA-binding domain-containing protein n=1 Tax=Candidatus Kentrum sp. DK TaxID=2126562 RepID=A0A450SKE9_9GAMM|nr:MAG: DNA-binding domain-containing protein [Candidatus Kentron sp. DK]